MSGSNKSNRVIDKNFEKIVQLWQTKYPDYREDKELFVKLLHGDFDINYKIPNGSTSFETDWMEGGTIFEVVDTDLDRCKALLDHGANFTVTDKKGSTVLLKGTTDYGYKSYLDSIGKSIFGDDQTSYTNLILSAHISSSNVKNPKDKNGLSHFHVACMYNRADAVKFFLKNGVAINETINSDSKFYPGFSALHFAAISCAVETVELLLKSGADMFAQDAKGMNPLHVLIFERRKILIQVQRVLRVPPTNIENWQCNKLQEHCNINLKIIHLFLERMNELGCTIDNTGFSYFHVLCLLGNASEIQQFLDNNTDALGQCVNVDSSVWPGYTPLHFAAHSNVETVELLVKKGADLGAKDTKGLTPFELCLKEFPIADVHRILLLYPDYFNITFFNSKTKLGDFISAMQDPTTFETLLQSNLSRSCPNTFIPLDSPVCAGFTSLHLAVVCAEQPMNWDSKNYDVEYILFADMSSEKSQNYLSRIGYCLRYYSDVTSIDARGWTPIHWAFKLQQIEAVYLLLAYHHSNSNPIGEHGLSHLHIACAAKNATIVEKLLSGGADINETATSSYNWMDVETTGWLGEQVQKYFINKGSTPLHFASSVRGHEIVKILIKHNADIFAKDADGFNALERLFKVPFFLDLDYQKRPCHSKIFIGSEKETVKLLVKSIGDQLADTKPKQMLYCYKLMADNLLSKILRQGDESTTKILESVGITALHVACYTRNLEQVNELVDKLDVNARVDLNSPLWPGYTPMYLLMMGCVCRDLLNDTPTNRAIMEKLLQSGVDLAVTNNKGDTPLHQIFEFYRFTYGETINYLKNCSVNPTGKAGYTHLHIASAYGATSIVEKLLEHGAEVDYKADYFAEHYAGYTALHLAVFFQRRDVVDLLLKYGANANSKNAEGGNSLHVANFKDRAAPCLELLQTLISAGADINLKDMHGETPLVALLKSRIRTKEEIELFLTPHMRFHTFNLITDEGFLAIALNRRVQMPIYDIACINASDVKDIDANGRNAIHNIVSFKRPDWGDLEDMMIDEDAIYEVYTSSEDYIREIRSMMKLGLNIDQLDSKGSTPLHLAAQMQNLTGIIGLLENGADINITDFDSKPAFAYSFELANFYRETNFENERKELRELDARILKVILTHIYKLNLTGAAISQPTREVGAKMREIQSYDASKIEKCMNEMEEMKDQRIDSTVTYYDFLSDTGAVSNFPYFLLRQKTAIGCAFEKEVEKLREKFPELTGILLWQYRKALARCNVIDSAVGSLKALVNFNIPPNISKIILRFLNNDELQNLINSTILD